MIDRLKSSKIATIVFYTILAVFLAIYIYSIDISKLSGASFVWQYFALATALGLFARYYGAFIWLTILSNIGAKGVFSQKTALLDVYAKSWLGRYIPGKATWILGKIYFASKLGVSKNKLAVSSVLEGALQIGTQLVLALVILLFDTRIDFIGGEVRWLLGLLIAIGVIILTPRVFNKIIGSLYKLYKKKDFDISHQVGSKIVIKSTLLYITNSIIYSLGFFFIAMTVYRDLAFADIFFVSSITILASAIGTVAIFAPSGLGVKEGVQIALLSIIMPTEIALIIAVTTRLWSILLDFVFFATSKLILRFVGRNHL